MPTDTAEAIVRDLAHFGYSRVRESHGTMYVYCAICEGQWVRGDLEDHDADCPGPRAVRLAADPERLPEMPYAALGSLAAEGS